MFTIRELSATKPSTFFEAMANEIDLVLSSDIDLYMDSWYREDYKRRQICTVCLGGVYLFSQCKTRSLDEFGRVYTEVSINSDVLRMLDQFRSNPTSPRFLMLLSNIFEVDRDSMDRAVKAYLSSDRPESFVSFLLPREVELLKAYLRSFAYHLKKEDI